MSNESPPVHGIAVDFDPAVWLPGPVDEDVDSWMLGAMEACLEDYRYPPNGQEADALREVLTAFAHADLACDFRFLRFVGFAQPPMVAMLSLYVGDPDVKAALTTFDPDRVYYDSTPRVQMLEPERHLRRSMAYTADDGLRSVIRYHRRVDDWDVDMVLSTAGADMKATALALQDYDDLARAVWFVDEHGERR